VIGIFVLLSALLGLVPKNALKIVQKLMFEKNLLN